jgi:phosphate transport system protein
MSVHLHKAIESLKERILGLSELVEETFISAIRAVNTGDVALATKIIEGDNRIDLAEVEVEEECLKILALHQPVATDLRFIVAVLKINSDLERIGDLAVNMASRARKLAEIRTAPVVQVDFQGGENRVREMLRKSLEALINLDEDTAKWVCAADQEVDNINRSVFQQVSKGIKEHPEEADRLIMLLSVSRNLERIADHTTNIAEDVLYMIRGEIVRHTRVE